MKRIIFVAKNLRMNGISSVILNCIRNMDLSDLQIHIFVGEPVREEYVEELKNYGCIVYIQRNRKKHPFSYYYRLLKVLRETKFDVIHVHTNSCTCVLELVLARLTGIKKRIAHCHNSGCNHTIIHKVLFPLFLLLYTDGLACSEEAGIHLFRNREFAILKNGIDIDRFLFNQEERTMKRNELRIDENQFVIGHVGGFNSQKNQTFLIDVFSRYVSSHPTAMLVLIGSGTRQKEIKEKASALGISEKVLFLGEKGNVNEYYNCFDCFCFPSLFEGLGIAAIEAQANGLPCLLSNRVPEAVSMSNQAVFSDLTVEKWIEELTRLQISDREESSKLNCQRIIESGYSIRTVAGELKKIYEA